MPMECEETVKDVAALYLDGDNDVGLPRHPMPVFLDERGRSLNKYANGSKVQYSSKISDQVNVLQTCW